MEETLGQACADCNKRTNGIIYTCLKCGVHYCYTCSYYTDWKCKKCGERLT